MKRNFKKIILTIRVALPLTLLGGLATAVIVGCETPQPAKKTALVKGVTRYMEPPHTEDYRRYLKTRRLVPVREIAPDVRISLAYATKNNIAGRSLYSPGMSCRLDESTAQKLAKAQAELRKQGLGLKIWDAYRPFSVQRQLWKAAGGSVYVADPNLWTSKHCSGRAVDVTLVDYETGREKRMPSRFDDFTKQAASNYTGSDPEVRRNLRALQGAMRHAGFKQIDMEWWHFANMEFYSYNIPAL